MTSMPILRPTAVRIEERRCIRCGVCDELLSVVRGGPERVSATPAALAAMAACPTGAIVWCDDVPGAVGG